MLLWSNAKCRYIRRDVVYLCHLHDSMNRRSISLSRPTIFSLQTIYMILIYLPIIDGDSYKSKYCPIKSQKPTEFFSCCFSNVSQYICTHTTAHPHPQKVHKFSGNMHLNIKLMHREIIFDVNFINARSNNCCFTLQIIEC